MPQRFIKYSREEPARTILFVVGGLTMFMQTVAVALTFAWLAVPNLILVLFLCGYALWATSKNSTKHMSIAAFWQFIIWLWSGIGTAISTTAPAAMLWFPMIVVAGAMGVVYIYLAHQKRQGY